MNPQQRLARLAALVPAGGSGAARAPFVLLVVVLLGSGLLALLLLNASLNQGSFQLTRLEQETQRLNEEQQALEQEIAGYSDPEELEKRARGLGMVPGGPPVFLGPDGTVRGAAHRTRAPRAVSDEPATADRTPEGGGRTGPAPAPLPRGPEQAAPSLPADSGTGQMFAPAPTPAPGTDGSPPSSPPARTGPGEPPVRELR